MIRKRARSGRELRGGRTARAARGTGTAFIVLCAAGLAGCPDSREAAKPDIGSAPPPAAAAFVAADAPPVAPLAFFDRACTNCHGPYGLFYGEEFARNLDDGALIHMVREMVTGPSRTELDDASLAALVAFHRQLAEPERGPFVVVTRAGGAEIAGEVSPGARVVVIADGREFEAHVEEHAWSVALDAAPERSLIIRASFPKGGAATELDAAEAAWTHRAPRAAPGAKGDGGA